MSEGTNKNMPARNTLVQLLTVYNQKVKRLKVSTFIYRHLQRNPDQQRFTVSGVLTGNDTNPFLR